MAAMEATGSGRANCALELEDAGDESEAAAPSLLQAPRPRTALRATPATMIFFAANVGLFMVAPRCRAWVS
jgi:hypothetical protein